MTDRMPGGDSPMATRDRRRRWRRVAMGVAAAIVMLSPRSVLACPVCGLAGTQENSEAYFAMTMLLSGLPLVMIAGVGYWVYRRSASDDKQPR